MKSLVAVDLCGGAGGWAVAARGLPVRIVLTVDVWREAAMTYRLNHPATTVVQEDLVADAVDWASLAGRVDLVLGGIPCQWLSDWRRVAVQSPVSGEEKQRNRALLDAVLAIVGELSPPWWCLEDVVGLARELPIFTPYTVLDARHWSPQRRKRLYVGRFPRPKRRANGEVLSDRLRPGPYRVGSRLYGREPRKNRSFSERSCLAWISERKSPVVCGLSSRNDAEAGIVDEALPGGLRQLEWQEAAALQGFPDDYLFYGSPSAVGQMIANAVQVDMARAILEVIVEEARGRSIARLEEPADSKTKGAV